MEKIAEILQRVSGTCQASSSYDNEAFETRKAQDYNELEGDLHLQDGYQCDLCRNKGVIMRPVKINDRYWSTATRDCRCMAVRRTIRNMKRSGLKNIIRDYTFGKYIAAEEWQKKIRSAAEAYAHNPEGWFVICGQSGAGKTHICTAICREFLLSGREVRYMLWRDEVVKLKACVNDTEEYGERIEGYKKAEVLYIDDLFKTGKDADGYRMKPTAADVNIAFEILNYRYNDPSLYTIISSECTTEDILDIDEAIGGRIYERTHGTLFNLKPDKAKNYRIKGSVEL